MLVHTSGRSSQCDPLQDPPRSLLECIDRKTGRVVPWKLRAYYEGLDQSLTALFFANDVEEVIAPPVAKKQRSKRGSSATYYDDESGTYLPLSPKQSCWYRLYVSRDPQNITNRFLAKFRRRFRVPYQQYLNLLDDARREVWFPVWSMDNVVDAYGRPGSPLELLVLGALRYLGRGWTFDDLEEVTAVSEETHRRFFHAFIEIGSSILFDKYVKAPKNQGDADHHMHEFMLAGCNGAVGSMDATHVILERCANRLRNAHLGYKKDVTARTYNLTVNHRRRILSTTSGHPARWNDKTLVLFDLFARGMFEGKVLQDVEFSLFERNGNDIISVKYRGAWLLVDNGYLKWSTTIPPTKVTADSKEIRWSQWLESLRKDVECTFGIMKGRFRILKSGIRLHTLLGADRIWKTCCALHNWLLDIDGLDLKWENGVRSDWEGPLGYHDSFDVENYVPFAIQRLAVVCPDARTFDSSGMGEGDDGGGVNIPCEMLPGIVNNNATTADGARIVRLLSQQYFKGKLVEHFDIMWTQRTLQWPKGSSHKPTL